MTQGKREETSFYNQDELDSMGFKYLGRNVQLSRKASYYGRGEMSFGDFSRVDDFTVISGKVEVGRYVHISNNSTLIAGSEAIEIGDFSTVSFGCRLFSKSDDFSGEFLINPTVPSEFNNVIHAKLIIGRYVSIGCNAIILPGLTLADGTGVGAGTLVNRSTEYFGRYIGVPSRRMGSKSEKIIQLAEELLKRNSQQ